MDILLFHILLCLNKFQINLFICFAGKINTILIEKYQILSLFVFSFVWARVWQGLSMNGILWLDTLDNSRRIESEEFMSVFQWTYSIGLVDLFTPIHLNICQNIWVKEQLTVGVVSQDASATTLKEQWTVTPIFIAPVLMEPWRSRHYWQMTDSF